MTTEQIDEIDALKIVSNTIDKLHDKAAAERVVRWAWGKYVGESEPIHAAAPRRARKATKPKRKGAPKNKKKETVSLVKDLNLKPEGGLSLKEFVDDKQPTSMKAKIAVCVYYLAAHTNVSPVTINHVYTSFKWLTWRLPADLKNMLHQTGSTGWLDTGDLNNIQLTTMGENHVEHDLPKAGKAK